MHLYDWKTDEELSGRDTKCKVTIIDDDQPGHIGFEETKSTIKVHANDEYAVIKLIRKNGTDGTVTVNYKTVELDKSESHAARRDIDYEHIEDVAVFHKEEAGFEIKVKILQHNDETDM